MTNEHAHLTDLGLGVGLLHGRIRHRLLVIGPRGGRDIATRTHRRGGDIATRTHRRGADRREGGHVVMCSECEQLQTAEMRSFNIIILIAEF